MLKRVGDIVKMLFCWVKVSKAIMAEDQVGATVEKTKLEESQRSALRCLTLFYIPDPNFFYPGSRIRIKEFKYFNHKVNK
jgi:hypothetical protein